jgi:hypothetical protein
MPSHQNPISHLFQTVPRCDRRIMAALMSASALVLMLGAIVQIIV